MTTEKLTIMKKYALTDTQQYDSKSIEIIDDKTLFNLYTGNEKTITKSVLINNIYIEPHQIKKLSLQLSLKSVFDLFTKYGGFKGYLIERS